MQSRTSPPKRKSMNQGYDNQRNFHRRSVHVSRLHNPIVPHHFDRTTHKKPQNHENHLGDSLPQNISSYTVFRRVNNPVHRYPYAQEDITQYPEDQSSSNSDPYGRTMDEIPKRYEYCVRRGVHNNDRSMPVSIQKKGKYYPEQKIKNYNPQYQKSQKKHPQRLQTLELQDSFQQQEKQLNNHKIKQKMIPKYIYLHNTQKKHKNKQENIPKRKSTHNYSQSPQKQNFQQEYLVIKKSPKISSKNKHFIQYTPLSKQSQDILQQIQRLYLNSQDQNVRIIKQKSHKINQQISPPKRRSHQNPYFQTSQQSDQILENQIFLENQITTKLKNIEKTMQNQNQNLKQHNQYLLNIIKKIQKQNKYYQKHIQQQNTQIQQLSQQKNAYMERCLQLQNLKQTQQKSTNNHYLQNSTDSDTQNQTINLHQPKNYHTLQGFKKHFQTTIEPSTKNHQNHNNYYTNNKYHNTDPTPKFSSTRQSPELIRKIQPKNQELLFQEQGSEILNQNGEKDQWTNTNSGFSMVRNLSHNIPVDFYTKQVSQQQNSQSMSNQSESKMAKYNTQPPNTPLPLHFVSQIDSLNQQFDYLMKQYKETRDISIRKECVKIAQKIKQLKKDIQNDNKTEAIKPQKKGLKKIQSLEMEIQQNKNKYNNKYQKQPFKFQN